MSSFNAYPAASVQPYGEGQGANLLTLANTASQIQAREAQAAQAQQQAQINKMAIEANYKLAGDPQNQDAMARVLALTPDSKLPEQLRGIMDARLQSIGALALTSRGDAAKWQAGLKQMVDVGLVPPEFAQKYAGQAGNWQQIVTQAIGAKEALAEKDREHGRRMAEGNLAVSRGNLDVARQNSQPEIQRLQSYRDQLTEAAGRMPEGSPQRQQIEQKVGEIDAFIAKKSTPSGGITIGPDGTVQIGGPAGGGLTKSSQNEVQKQQFTLEDASARLGEITSAFDSKFLRAGEQVSQWISGLQDKTIGGLSPDGQAALMEYTDFKSSTLDNLNRYIQDITGAAMGVDEAKRIIATAPNMDDSPVEFEAKLRRVTRSVENALLRYRYAQVQGGTMLSDIADDRGPALGDIRNKIKSEAVAYVRKTAPNATREQALELAQRYAQSRYGYTIGQ